MSAMGFRGKAPAVAGAFLVLFVLLAIAVHLRLLAEVDYAVGRWVRSVDIAPLNVIATVVSMAGSAEFSILYGLIGAAILWRRGAGWWSLAPLAFLLITSVEVVLKEIVHQPLPPPEITRPHLYPLPISSSGLEGAFPSGYSQRVSFFCVFLGVLFWSRARGGGWWVAAACIVVATVLLFTRVYVGWHWASDVVGGFLLGGAVALILAPGTAASLGNYAARRNSSSSGSFTQ